MYNYYVKNGKEKSVRGLGWIMRYMSRHLIKEIVVHEHASLDFDITFVVYFDNNVTYHCDFKDKMVFYEWLGNRCSLYGVQIKRIIHWEQLVQFGTIEKQIVWRDYGCKK